MINPMDLIYEQPIINQLTANSQMSDTTHDQIKDKTIPDQRKPTSPQIYSSIIFQDE